MQISISGQQIDVGAALREHAEDSLKDGVSKYFENAIDADVVFSKEAHLFCVDILVNEGTGTGVVIKSQGKAGDIYAAFDQAAERIEKQLRRYKRRLKDHQKEKLSAKMEEALAARKYVLPNDESEEGDDNPLIIAEKETVIEALTVSDAVMRMHLANLPALMFINKKTGQVNVVYERKDGNISWVEADAAEIEKASAA